MTSEVRTDFWVHALLRTVQTHGGMAYVVRRGDDNAGAVLIKITKLDGTARLLVPARNSEGERIYLDLTGKNVGPDEKSIDDYLTTRSKQDQDVWIVEIEDRLDRNFIVEHVD
ncbi:DUF1491 family protein [Candidatus Phycosocius spiralis]|uniref:DUF1491 domain-containing protein n=1 Tax=Candidatus Phycosocius spiralis TaxID=2815099 RepID=A0ABQ4PYE8_9PROT|nr:DUF1491 family protein [Candidatus Phycosocius spiralis]GIU68037.1 hypothetical protein PsB1_2191 [Candidatus Phycosocius spiralis]